MCTRECPHFGVRMMRTRLCMCFVSLFVLFLSHLSYSFRVRLFFFSAQRLNFILCFVVSFQNKFCAFFRFSFFVTLSPNLSLIKFLSFIKLKNRNQILIQLRMIGRSAFVAVIRVHSVNFDVWNSFAWFFLSYHLFARNRTVRPIWIMTKFNGSNRLRCAKNMAKHLNAKQKP